MNGPKMTSVYWSLGCSFTVGWDPLAQKPAGARLRFFFTHLIVVSFLYKWNLIINGMCSRIKKLITEGGSDYTGRKGVYDQLGIFREMAHVQRGRWARGKSRMKETEKWKGDSELDMITVLVSGVHVISCVQLVCVVLAQSCNPLCNPTDSSPPGSSVHGVFQERMLEGIAISSSRGSSPTWDQAMSPALAGWFFTTEPPGNSIDLRTGSYKYCSFWAERVHEGFCVWRKKCGQMRKPRVKQRKIIRLGTALRESHHELHRKAGGGFSVRSAPVG